MNKIYMTKGVQMKVDIVLVMVLFEMRERIPIKEYLTIIHIKRLRDRKSYIMMEQEEPKYCIEQEVDCELQESLKLYIIDDGENLTCLLPSEY